MSDYKNQSGRRTSRPENHSARNSAPQKKTKQALNRSAGSQGRPSAGAGRKPAASAAPQKKPIGAAVTAQKKPSAKVEAERKKVSEKTATAPIVTVQRKPVSQPQKKPQETTHAKTVSEQDERLLKHKDRILRQTRKQEISLASFNIAVLISVFVFATLFMTFGKRPTVSEEEKRELAKMPKFSLESYFDGSFTNDFSEFYNDTVPMRSSFKSFIALFRGHLGIDYDGGVELIGGGGTANNNPPDTEKPSESKTPSGGGLINTASKPQNSGSSSSSSEQPTESSTSSDVEVPPPADKDGEMSDRIFVLSDGRGIMLYGGSYAVGQYYANAVNAYKQALPDVNVYSLVAPTAGSFYLPKKYQNLMASELDNIKNINSYLDGVIPVDAYNALAAHVDEHIYATTDHHWEPLGAYYAAEAFAKTAGVPFAPLSEYDMETGEGYLGSLYEYSGFNQKMKDHPDTFTILKPKAHYTATYYDTSVQNPFNSVLILGFNAGIPVGSWYSMIMGGDNKVVHVKTEVNNGRKLVLVKDSYGNAMVPSLVSSFEEIWVVDMRYFDLSLMNFCREKGITDLLVASSSFSATSANAYCLPEIM